METNGKGMGARRLTEEQRKMVEDHCGLIYAALKKCCFQCEYEDYYGVAAEGLCNAARTYDPSVGTKFSTYAMKCMINACNMVRRKDRALARGGDTIAISLSSPVPESNGLCIEDTLASNVDLALECEQSMLIRKVLSELAIKYSLYNQCGTIDKMAIFKSVCIDGMKQREVAQKFGICQSYVYRIVRQVRGDLVKMLEREGVETW